MLMLATAALVLPSLAASLHSPASGHEGALSVAVAIVLLVVFALSLPAALRREPAATAATAATAAGPGTVDGGEVHLADADLDVGAADVGAGVKALAAEDGAHHEGHWPTWLSIVLLAAAAGGAALVSEWFIDALTPAMA